MKRTAPGIGKSSALPVAWRDAEYAALRFVASDTCDDRVSDSIYDAEDERLEVDGIVRRMDRIAN